MSKRRVEEKIMFYSDFIKFIPPYLSILKNLGIGRIIDSIVGRDGLIHIILGYPSLDNNGSILDNYRVTDAIEFFNVNTSSNEYFTLSGFDYNEILRKLDYISACYVLGTLERWH